MTHAAPDAGPSEGEFPVVGIGASAGGLAAFEAFFAGMPPDQDPGMAFVLVQHLAPDHPSMLAEIVSRYTPMEVQVVTDGMSVRKNCVYVIPQNRDLAFLGGLLQLLDPAEPVGHRLPIDSFFRSLAADQRERAIGVVLAGTGSDGTLGARAIKAEGGMVMAQAPASAAFDGMPRSVIAAGLADYELSPSEMPAQLIAYASRAWWASPRSSIEAAEPLDENALRRIFVLLRAQTGHDFSEYKANTIKRRLDRRLAVHRIDTIEAYVKFLQQEPAEVAALFRDLLIGVTGFFRDREVFGALEARAIPRLLEDRPPDALVRVWCAGCSTGEEAYSLAILFKEGMEALKVSFTLQVFATDIDAEAIAIARAGRYPATIAAQMPPARLGRWFTAEADGSFRIAKSIRDLLVFSEHDVIKDPPFSRLDLISCRNLLIYLSGALQQRLLPVFHYALNPGGILLLGTSESVGDLGDMFAPLDREAKIFERTPDGLTPRRFASRSRPILTSFDERPRMPRPATDPGARLPPRELMEKALLQQVAPAGALVNGQGDVVYLHGRTGMYLEPTPGEPTASNILRMAREGLRTDLAATLRRAVSTRDLARFANVTVRTNGHTSQVDLAIRPLAVASGAGSEPDLYLIIFEESRPGVVDPKASNPAPPDARTAPDQEEADQMVVSLREELKAKEEFLQSANEELETSNEDLRASNEEMQSINEEFQSTNEELETSKEELQSVNEELATVNAELHTKVADLSQTNNDMNNLLAGTGIATVFVDHALRILRFTPAATRITNLIHGDIGRPVAHIVSNLVGYDRLAVDAQAVLDTLVPRDVEVQSREGNWYLMRIHPYRTRENVIEGAVISFLEITEMKRAAEALREANDLLRLAVVVRDATDAITVQDLEGKIMAWNPGAVRLYGWSESEALAMNTRSRIPEALRAEELARLERLALAQSIEPYRTHRLTRDGSVVEVSTTSTALVDQSGRVYAIATTEREFKVTGGGAAKESGRDG